jgi:ABC-type transporter Mla subunit MlaD
MDSYTQQIKDDALERAIHMVSLCRHADATASEIVIALADQGDQLRNIDANLSTMDATLNDTKQNIKRLKGITKRVVDSFRTKFHQKLISKIMLHSTKKQNSLSLPSSPLRRVS